MDTNISECWNALFSSLAFAEKAAANECLKIAERFHSLELNTLAKKYELLAEEEHQHYKLAFSVVKKLLPLTHRAEAIYNGEYFSLNGPIIERLMTIHLVFEPSALAFLGYLSAHAHELISDKEWVNKIKKAFNAILLDEVDHVQSGTKLIEHFWKRSTLPEKAIALKTMKKHRAFLKAGLKSFFKDDIKGKEHTSKMLARYDFYYKKALKGVLDNDSTKIAS